MLPGSCRGLQSFAPFRTGGGAAAASVPPSDAMQRPVDADDGDRDADSIDVVRALQQELTMLTYKVQSTNVAVQVLGKKVERAQHEVDTKLDIRAHEAATVASRCCLRCTPRGVCCGGPRDG